MNIDSVGTSKMFYSTNFACKLKQNFSQTSVIEDQMIIQAEYKYYIPCILRLGPCWMHVSPCAISAHHLIVMAPGCSIRPSLVRKYRK